ncbi:hypothetical protein F1649_14970 [Arcticibacter tournemirensis]|uniref:Uncharacterized protein n=1 Tax=Arcticibacter tournemirensis TaxID=699437 RepID=A0A5M9H845_9SPHI|nr:hypothetical protein F1649_14970 [Arcticibacter tournemirensis]
MGEFSLLLVKQQTNNLKSFHSRKPRPVRGFLLFPFSFQFYPFCFILSAFPFLLSTFHFQLFPFNFSLSAFNFPLSAFHFQLSTFNFQLSAICFLLSPFPLPLPRERLHKKFQQISSFTGINLLILL